MGTRHTALFPLGPLSCMQKCLMVTPDLLLTKSLTHCMKHFIPLYLQGDT